MKCEKITDLMSDYIDDCLFDTVRVEFELHVQVCEDCSRELALMQDMLTSLQSLSDMKSPVDCWSEVRARISRRESVWSVVLHCVMRPCVAAPAFALGILLALFLVWPSPMDDPSLEQQVNAPNIRATTASKAEFVSFIGAHNRVEHEQDYSDPDVTFIAAEMERVAPR